MSQVELYAPFKKLHGGLEKNSGIVMRQKKYRAPNGAVLKEGVQETFKVANPRDFEKTPPQGAERANMRRFGDVSLMTTEIIRSERYPEEELAAMTQEERAHVADLRAQLEDFRTRFYDQFKRPDEPCYLTSCPEGVKVRLLRSMYRRPLRRILLACCGALETCSRPSPMMMPAGISESGLIVPKFFHWLAVLYALTLSSGTYSTAAPTLVS